MKTGITIIFTAFLFNTLIGQPDHRVKLMDNEEVRFFVENHPDLEIEDIVNCDFTAIMYHEGISFVGISGLLLGYQLNETEFNKEFNLIKNSYSYLFPLEAINLAFSGQYCNRDTVVPDILTILETSYFRPQNSSKMFLLENQLGKFIDDEFLTFPHDCPDPDHGKSSGAVVDSVNKKIIYWVIFW